LSTVRKAHYFFIVTGAFFLELFYLLQSKIYVPHGVVAVLVLLAALGNLLFLRLFEQSLKGGKALPDADAVLRSHTIPEKIAVLQLWFQLGRLRLAVFVAVLLVNLLSAVYFYQCLSL
jgi:hypothetical protein